MKNTAKLIVVCVFALGMLLAFLAGRAVLGSGGAGVFMAEARATPPVNVNAKPAVANTKPAIANMAANSPGSVGPANTGTDPAAGDKKIPKSFTLGLDSQSEDGEVAFDHDSHAFAKYSPDGTKVMGCV